jgi:UrcA family protein
MLKMKSSLFVVLIGAALCAQADEPHRQVVKFGDLDLNRPAGAQSLYRRIVSAASTVCVDLESRELSKQLLHKKCEEEAISGAVLGVNQPLLSAYYTSQHHGKELHLVGQTSTHDHNLVILSAR